MFNFIAFLIFFLLDLRKAFPLNQYTAPGSIFWKCSLDWFLWAVFICSIAVILISQNHQFVNNLCTGATGKGQSRWTTDGLIRYQTHLVFPHLLMMSHIALPVKQYRWGLASWTQFKFVMRQVHKSDRVREAPCQPELLSHRCFASISVTSVREHFWNKPSDAFIPGLQIFPKNILMLWDG